MMARWPLSVLLALVCVLVGRLSGVDAEGVKVDVGGRLALPDRSIVPTTKVVLNGGELSCFSAQDGSFVFRDVAPGMYLLEVMSTLYHFSHAKVRIDKGGEINVLEFKYSGGPKLEAPYPLLLSANTKWSYFEHKEGPKVGKMFKNPMTLMMVGSMAMMFFLPKMMAGMDPEQLKEFEAQQKAATGGGLSFTDMLSKAYGESAQPQPPTQGQGGSGVGGGSASGAGGSSSSSHRKKKGNRS